MGRYRTWLVVLGLALTTPLIGGCLTTTIAGAVIHKVRERKPKSEAHDSRTERRDSQQRPASVPQQQEAPPQPEY